MIKVFCIFTLFLIIPTFLTFIKLLSLQKLKKFTREQRRAEQKKYVKQISEIYGKEREQLYFEAHGLFNRLMKAGLISRPEILKIKAMLNKSLGVYIKEYKKMHFKNDAHEIYTKMKNQHIDRYEWEEIIDYLQDLSYETEKVVNLKQYRNKIAK